LRLEKRVHRAALVEMSASFVERFLAATSSASAATPSWIVWQHRGWNRRKLLFEVTGERQRLFGETSYAAGTWDRSRRVILKAQRKLLFEVTGERQRLFGKTSYAAGTWDRSRRVILKAQRLQADPNRRFMVTSLDGDPQQLDDQVDAQRGDMENRIFEKTTLWRAWLRRSSGSGIRSTSPGQFLRRWTRSPQGFRGQEFGWHLCHA
jgi:hypothetical protein